MTFDAFSYVFGAASIGTVWFFVAKAPKRKLLRVEAPVTPATVVEVVIGKRDTYLGTAPAVFLRYSDGAEYVVRDGGCPSRAVLDGVPPRVARDAAFAWFKYANGKDPVVYTADAEALAIAQEINEALKAER